MKKIYVGKEKIQIPEIGLGCMRINSLEERQAEKLIHVALENEVNFFDHADIYGAGQCETFFAKAINMNSAIREKMLIQTKCGIRPGICFDFSKEHILRSVDNSLRRLRTEYIDFLLLHRPDTLMDPQEVAEAFSTLENSGKVKHFGVSNQNPFQIALLNKYFDDKIKINQLQFSITNCGIVDAGFNVNMSVDAGINRDGGILEYCRLNDITIQAWSPFQYGFFEGVFLNNKKFPELNNKIDEIASKYKVANTTIAVAWILRHPAKIQPIVGTTNVQRFIDVCKASDVDLTREEWYEIYCAAGKKLP